jgi:DNA-binding NtrC family response regulator
VFRPDLLYRVNTVDIVLPPLRDRREDIPLLLEHFIAVYADKYNVALKRLSARALERLMGHTWPGNVRELRHAVERAVILAAGPMLEAEDFSLAATPRAELAPSPPAAAESARLDAIEKDAIARVLQAHSGNISRAASALGLTRASLYRRMQKYGL